MRTFWFVLIFILLLISKIYSYSSPIIQFDNSITILGATDYVSVGLELAALIIALRLSFTAPDAQLNFKRVERPILIICIILSFWLIISFSEIGIVDTFYSPVSPIAYLPILLVMLGADDKCWVTLLRISPIFAAIYCIQLLMAYNLYVVTLGMNLAGNTPVTNNLVTTIWWLAVSTIEFKRHNRIVRLLVICMLITCTLIAFNMTYRSWIIQPLLILIIAIFQLGQKRTSKFFIGIIAIAIAISAIDYIISSDYWGDAIQSLDNKNKSDTRSFQYEEIFNQTSLSQWLLGGGLNATYVSTTNGGGDYKYIDNQFVFTAFHYGLLVLIPWILIWCKGIYGVVINKCLTMDQKSKAFVCVLWMCALGGLSVYNVIQVNSQNIIMSIVLGRCLYAPTRICPNTK